MRRLFIPAGLVALSVALGAVLFSGAGAASPTTGVLLSAPDPGSQLQLGKTLFDSTCSSCHGLNAAGGALAPNLRGVGAATVDLWVSSGWMPLATPGTQPIKKPAVFDRTDTEAIANYIGSLAGGPAIPEVNTAGANVADGFSMFALNCAPCHTITGAGDALSNGITAPTLHDVTVTQIMEAIRTGPGNMPRFSSVTVTPTEAKDIVAYVTTGIRHPQSPGGLNLGGVGPVAEGFVGLFVGVGVCVLIAMWIGDRTEEEDESEGHGTDGTKEDPGVAHV